MTTASRFHLRLFITTLLASVLALGPVPFIQAQTASAHSKQHSAQTGENAANPESKEEIVAPERDSPSA